MSDDEVILIWGLPRDPPIAVVHQALQARGCPVVLLDQWKVAETQVELTVSPGTYAQYTIDGVLHFSGVSYDLSKIRSMYLRPYDHCELPMVAKAGVDSDLWQHSLAVEESLMTWADLTPTLVVNRPSSMVANSSKPYQSAWIASLGFRVPETLVTTDPAAALEFWEEHTEVIYKSVSGRRSIVSRLRPEHRDRLADLAACPTQFQQYIPGTEHRVHVVGEKVFACRIISEADDYRYSKDVVDLAPCELPQEISDLCRTAAVAMHLPLAGIDLRCTPDGLWYCLEVNPSPGFSYFDINKNPSIGQAVAEMLSTNSQRSRLL